jgi:hypothetical protein
VLGAEPAHRVTKGQHGHRVTKGQHGRHHRGPPRARGRKLQLTGGVGVGYLEYLVNIPSVCVTYIQIYERYIVPYVWCISIEYTQCMFGGIYSEYTIEYTMCTMYSIVTKYMLRILVI